MPKQIIEIRGFQNGIVCAPSETDIPLDACSYSLNVDPMAEEGKLCGIPDDVTHIEGLRARSVAAIKAVDDTKTLVYYTEDPYPSIGVVEDFFGEPGSPTEVVAVNGNTPCMSISSHEAHIGLGPDQESKWVGHLQQGQFNNEPITDIQVMDAKLGQFVSGVNSIHKSVFSSLMNAYVGIEFGGNKIYLIDLNGGIRGDSMSSSSNLLFKNIQAICISNSYVGEKDVGVWIYDNDGTEFGTLYEVGISKGPSFENSTFTIEQTCDMQAWGGYGVEEPGSYTVTDIIQGENTYKDVWFSMYYLGDGVKITAKRSTNITVVSPIDDELSGGYPTLLFRTNGTPVTGSVQTVNMSPDLHGGDRLDNLSGMMFLRDEVDDSNDYFNLATLKTPLFNIKSYTSPTWSNTDSIGWFCNFRSGTVGPKISTQTLDPGVRDHEWRKLPLSVYMIQRGMVAGVTGYPNQTGIRIRQVLFAGEGHASPSLYDKNIRHFSCVNVNEGTGTDEFIVVALGYSDTVALYSFWADLDEFGTSSFDASDNIIGLKSNEAGTVGEADSVCTRIFRPSLVKVSDGNISMFCNDGGYMAATIALNNDGIFGTESWSTVGDFIITGRDGNIQADGMRETRRYRYFMALEYDGYQIGPMSSNLLEVRPSGDGKGIFLDVYFKPAEITNKRITGVYILRSFYEGLVSTEEDSLPRVIGRIDISTISETKNLAGENYYYATIKDSNSPAETFYELSGYPHTEKICTPRYGLSCVGESINFVANCGGVDGIKYTSNYGFFSERGKYDQFDLSNKFVIFSDTPSAVAYYRGRFYAFTKNKFWRINPAGPYIEDEFDGIGCEGPKALLANEFGLFVAGTNNFYLDSGNGFVPIGYSILTSDYGIGWNERDKTVPPVVSFDMERLCFVVSFLNGNGAYISYAYNVGKERFDLWQTPGNFRVYDSIIGDAGENFVFSEYDVFEYLGGTGNRVVSWISRVIDAGIASIKKKWYKIRMPYKYLSLLPDSSITMTDQDGAQILFTSVAQESHLLTRRIDSAYGKKRGVRVHLNAIPGACRIDSISATYRVLEGIR